MKVKPNKNALILGLINYTQKQDTKMKIKEEQGITLIVLLVTVILLVILTGVAVAQITGNEGIINSTEVAVDDYQYQQYKEQIEQLVHSIILADSLAGRTTTVTSMAADMENESWIKSATPNEESKDIIVTVQEGYVYQVYYDELTGMSGVDNIGTEDGASLPTVTATYNKETYKIEVTANCEDGIEKIELIYGGEVVQTANSETASFEVEESGWYQVKATSTKGKTRYANVRVSNEVGAPSIAITSNGESENDWYGKDNVPVEVTISTEEANVTGIYYKRNTDEDYTYVEGRSTAVTINTSGRTVIYAYAVDSKGNESDIVRIEVKYDNVAPQVGAVAVSPEAPESGWYNTDVVVSIPNAEDANSGIAGYYYWEVVGNTPEVPDEEKTYVSGASKTLTIKSEGIKTIAFQAIDRAGNKSGISNITVQKDSTNPSDFSLNIINDSTTSFTVNTGTTDDTTYTNDVSGMDRYEIYLDGNLAQTIEVTDQNVPSISYKAENLSENTTYTVYVIAYDKAGNSRRSANMTVSTANVNTGGGTSQPSSQLLAPAISLTGATQTNGYYTGNVIVTIEDSASISTTKAVKVKYQVAGANAIEETEETGRMTMFTINADGASTITAWVEDSEGNQSETSTQIILKDTKAPTAVSLTVTSYDRTSISVKASGADETSGIISYAFQISPTQNEQDFTTIRTEASMETSCSYTYTGLTLDTTYYLRVVVTDRAGNGTISTIIRQTTQDNGVTEIFLAESIGKYVDYVPTNGNFSVGSNASGYEYSQNLSTVSDLKWRILFAENNILTLISESPAAQVMSGGSLPLQGYNGYNNGVKLLNDACKSMYSNSSLGAVGRSIKIEDIEAVSSYVKTSYPQYGTTTSYSTPNYGNTYYPNIYADEMSGTVAGIGQSEQDEYYYGYTLASTLILKWTYYSYTMSTTYLNSTYLELFYYTASSVDEYWIASRCVSNNSYYLFYVDANTINAEQLLNTNRYEPSATFKYIRPVVEIDLSNVTIGETGTGTRTSPYSIVAK